jgi:Divergent InlB B-repeat domain
MIGEPMKRILLNPRRPTMETILRLTRYHYLVGLSIFFITVALIAGIVSCGGNVSGNSESYTLTISSTSGGSVTEPGEGTFACNATAVVNLTAEADEGHSFVGWTGDVDTIGNVSAAVTTITMEDDYSITANFVGVEAAHVGVEPGDWVKFDYTFTGWPAGETYPDWLKLEFLSVEGTTATVRFTQHVSDGTQHSGNATVDIVSDVEVPVLAGIVIYANRTIGDSVYIAEYGNATVEGEATRTYAGASRTVVYTNLSYNEAEVTYYWDKLTGVMVEISSTYPEFTATAKVAGTNMWETPAIRIPWWTWTIVALMAAGLVIFFVRRRRST